MLYIKLSRGVHILERLNEKLVSSGSDPFSKASWEQELKKKTQVRNVANLSDTGPEVIRWHETYVKALTLRMIFSMMFQTL